MVQTNVFGKKWQSCYLTESRIMLFKCGKRNSLIKSFPKTHKLFTENTLRHLIALRKYVIIMYL